MKAKLTTVQKNIIIITSAALVVLIIIGTTIGILLSLGGR